MTDRPIVVHLASSKEPYKMSKVSKSNPAEHRRIAHPAALWGIFGFVLILAQAIYRLTPLAWQPLAGGEMETWHYGLYAFSILFNGYFEGYKAFQLQVAPRVIARADHLAAQPRLLHVVLAPFFCMAMFHASTRRLIISWSVYAGIIVLIIGVRQLSQPWRGIVDAGVVIGLSWGIIALVAAFADRLRGGELRANPEVPD